MSRGLERGFKWEELGGFETTKENDRLCKQMFLGISSLKRVKRYHDVMTVNKIELYLRGKNYTGQVRVVHFSNQPLHLVLFIHSSYFSSQSQRLFVVEWFVASPPQSHAIEDGARP
jgi:hypothetical protein